MATNTDLNFMQSMGRNYVKEGKAEFIQKAAEYLVIAGPESEEVKRLLWWFHEGVRNSADSQQQTETCMTVLKIRTIQIAEKDSDEF